MLSSVLNKCDILRASGIFLMQLHALLCLLYRVCAVEKVQNLRLKEIFYYRKKIPHVLLLNQVCTTQASALPRKETQCKKPNLLPSDRATSSFPAPHGTWQWCPHGWHGQGLLALAKLRGCEPRCHLKGKSVVLVLKTACVICPSEGTWEGFVSRGFRPGDGT